MLSLRHYGCIEVTFSFGEVIRNNKKRGHDTTSLKLNLSDCKSLEYHLSAIANINTLLRRLINLSSINCIGAIHFAD